MSERILAFDTSGASLSVALWEGGRTVWLFTREFPPGRPGHAAALVPAWQRGLVECGWSVSSLDGVGVTVGPGSYTGLRIGIASAKGLALARGLPAAGVGTLEALAWPWLGPECAVLAWLDARRGQVFAAVYAAAAPAGGAAPGGAGAAGAPGAPRTGEAPGEDAAPAGTGALHAHAAPGDAAPLELAPPARMPSAEAAELAAQAAAGAGRAVLCAAGDGELAPGAAAALAAAAARRGLRLWRAPLAARVSAEAVAALAAARLRAGGGDPLTLVPLYAAPPHVAPRTAPGA
ncbi:MAG: tRNA (adenosine(37)-N6)-threonylcarbamoyltransferase complex dimerization subunit type 1 TsaB [Firmicutes bacterium]|nr:tRNA (adenosine(37)-N6)-threonylcarbamoyltransferase complex dimerization subunit type 1 TsaB [Bacillota bacterium]